MPVAASQRIQLEDATRPGNSDFKLVTQDLSILYSVLIQTLSLSVVNLAQSVGTGFYVLTLFVSMLEKSEQFVHL